MKIIDSNGKIFGKINLIDLAIVLLVIFFVVGIFQKTATKSENKIGDVTIEYTLLVNGIRQTSVDAIEKNYENITETLKQDVIGDIVGVECLPAEEIVECANGEYMISHYNDKYDVYVTIRTEGRKNARGIFSESGKKLMYGDTIKFSNGFCETSGMVEKIVILD